MSEQHSPSWDAVRASLELPKKDRFAAIGLPDKRISDTMQWAGAQLNGLVEYGVDEHHPAARELVALMNRITKLGGVPARAISFYRGLEIGGTLKKEEERHRDETLERIRFVLRSVFEDMIQHNQGSREKHDSLISLVDHNETREKQLETERRAAEQYEESIARIMNKHGISRDAAVERVDRDPFSNINLERARELGLTREHVSAYPAAQAIIERIIDQSNDESINMNVPEGRHMCDATWKQVVPHLPRPNDRYLQQLQSGTIISNLDVGHRKIFARPAFGRERDVFVDNWEEVDWDKTVAIRSNERVLEQPTTSPLLAAFFMSDGSVVSITRARIDATLWEGDPADRNKTPIHRTVIEGLGLDPDTYFFRCIPQDTYARLAKQKQWGNSKLNTHFDDYLFEGADVHGLSGGRRGSGGPSCVGRDHRGIAVEDLAVRLVLECNK